MEKPRNRLEDARSAKLRVELSERRVACVDRQQRSKERHRGAIGLTKRGGRAVDPIANHLVGVAGLNGECALEQVDERVKRQRAAEGHGRSLQPGRATAGPAVELVQQARLADARVAGHEHRLTIAFFDLQQQILEHGDFAGA